MCKEQIIKQEQMETGEKEKQVPRQLKLLDNNLNELDNAIEILRDKLSHVLNEDFLAAKDPEEDQDLVPLAAQIRGFDRRLCIMLSTVRYFSEACQLK